MFSSEACRKRGLKRRRKERKERKEKKSKEPATRGRCPCRFPLRRRKGKHGQNLPSLSSPKHHRPKPPPRPWDAVLKRGNKSFRPHDATAKEKASRLFPHRLPYISTSVDAYVSQHCGSPTHPSHLHHTAPLIDGSRHIAPGARPHVRRRRLHTDDRDGIWKEKKKDNIDIVI